MSSDATQRVKKTAADDQPEHPGPPPQIVRSKPPERQPARKQESQPSEVTVFEAEAVPTSVPLNALGAVGGSVWHYAAAFFVIAVGVLALVVFASLQNFIPYGERFNDENAVGATANRLTKLLNGQWGMRPGEIILAGVLLLVLARLTEIRSSLERLSQRRPND
jgi:hypothetical protein